MSGISAVWNRGTELSPVAANQAVLHALSPYGPDATDLWSGASFSCGRTLMRLVPEDAFDRQPAWTTDHRVCIIADLRLDNRQDLLRELGLSQPETLSDVDILTAAWQRWDAACLDHIKGGFAFAVWNPHTQELFAARDHSGECPLFYHQTPDLFALASMPRGLRAIPGVGRQFNDARFAAMIALDAQDRHASFFAGISRLPPGHFLRVTRTSLEIHQYWHPMDAPQIRFKCNADYAEKLLEVLDDATRPRLRSIGLNSSQLSSGLDSSSVMSSAALILQQTGENLLAYTSVPQEGFSPESYSLRPVIDEGPFAAEVAALYPNVTHVPMSSRGVALVPALAAANDLLGEPIQNGINWLWITAFFRHAQQHNVGTMLQGSFGNATFSFWTPTVMSELFRRGHWLTLANHIYTLRMNNEMSLTNSARAALEGTFKFRSEELAPQGQFSPDDAMVNPDFARLHPPGYGRTADQDAPPDLTMDRRLFFEWFDLAPINAAFRGLSHIDLRDPTGDKALWEYCYGIPFEQYAIDGHSRSLVRRAMQGRLPEATRLRYRQGRQAADWYLTMREALPSLQQEMENIRQSPAANRMLNLPRMQHLLDTFPQRGYGTIHVMNTWKYAWIRCFSIAMFLRRHDPDLPTPNQA